MRLRSRNHGFADRPWTARLGGSSKDNPVAVFMAHPSTLTVIPKLADLVIDPGKAASLPLEAIPALLGELERLKATLWARLTVPQGNGQGQAQRDRDRLLNARAAAVKLGTSQDWLYRRSQKLPFTVRIGRKVLFSEAGIERYIRQRMGR